MSVCTLSKYKYYYANFDKYTGRQIKSVMFMLHSLGGFAKPSL